MPNITTGMMPRHIKPPCSVHACCSTLVTLGAKSRHVNQAEFSKKDLHSKLLKSVVYTQYRLEPSLENLNKVLKHLELDGLPYSTSFEIFQNPKHSLEQLQRYLLMPFIVYAFAHESVRVQDKDIYTLILYATTITTSKEKMFGNKKSDKEKAEQAAKVLDVCDFIFEAFQCSLIFGCVDQVFTTFEEEFESGKNVARFEIVNHLKFLLEFYTSMVVDSVQKQAVASKIDAKSGDKTKLGVLSEGIKINLLRELLQLITHFGLRPNLLTEDDYSHQFSSHFWLLLQKCGVPPSVENMKRSSVKNYIIKMLTEGGYLRYHEISQHVEGLVDCVVHKHHQLPMFYLAYMGLVLNSVAFQPGCTTLNGGHLQKNHNSACHDIKLCKPQFSDTRLDGDKELPDEMHKMLDVSNVSSFEQLGVRRRDDIETRNLHVAVNFFVPTKNCDLDSGDKTLPFSLDHHRQRKNMLFGGCSPEERMSTILEHVEVLLQDPNIHNVTEEQVIALRRVQMIGGNYPHGARGIDHSVLHSASNVAATSKQWRHFDEYVRSKNDEYEDSKEKRKKQSSSEGEEEKKIKKAKATRTKKQSSSEGEEERKNKKPRATRTKRKSSATSATATALDDKRKNKKAKATPTKRESHASVTATAAAPVKTLENCRDFYDSDPGDPAFQEWLQNFDYKSVEALSPSPTVAVGSDDEAISPSPASGTAETQTFAAESDDEGNYSVGAVSLSPVPISSPSPELNETDVSSMLSLEDIPFLESLEDIEYSTMFDENDEKESESKQLQFASEFDPCRGKVLDTTFDSGDNALLLDVINSQKGQRIHHISCPS